MKKMTNSLGIKIGAFLLFVVFIIAFAGSLFGICILEGNNVYNDGGKTLHQNMAISYINSNLWEVYQAYEGVYYFNNANQEDESVQEEKRIIENSILDRYNENVSNFMFQM